MKTHKVELTEAEVKLIKKSLQVFILEVDEREMNCNEGSPKQDFYRMAGSDAWDLKCRITDIEKQIPS